METQSTTPCDLNERSLVDDLHKSGHHMTRQRRAIYEMVLHCSGHPTTFEVYRKLRETFPHISLATIYKGLEALVAAGLVDQVPRAYDEPARFEAHKGPHPHARCVGCHRVWDLETVDTPLPVQELLGKRRFKPVGSRVELLIECPVKSNTRLGQVPNSICPLDTNNPIKKKRKHR